MSNTNKVLVVDDSRTLRDQIAFTLQRNGYPCIQAENGLDGLVKLKDNKKDIKLIILDVNMPEMNGWEMLDRVKSSLDGEISRIPVLMLTTETDISAIDEARNKGAKAWLTKPFLPASLIGAVEKLTKLI